MDEIKTYRVPLTSEQILIGATMFVSYFIEVGLWFVQYLLFNHWYTTGQETIGWNFWIFVAIFARYAGFCDESAGDVERQRRYSFHWYIMAVGVSRFIGIIYRMIIKTPFRVGLKDES